MKNTLLAFSVLALALCIATKSTADLITAIDPPGSVNTNALGISGNYVVGVYYSSDTVFHGFVYNMSTSGYTTIGAPGTYATAVSGDYVVGTFGVYKISTGTYLDGPTNAPRISGNLVVGGAQIFNITGGSTPAFGSLPGTQATGISGVNVTGNFGSTGSTGFFFNGSTGNYSTITAPGAIDTTALAISGDKVVGFYDAGTGNHGFLYSGSTATFTTFDPPGSSNTVPLAISGNNVVGYYTGLDSSGNGFLYDTSSGAFVTIRPPGSAHIGTDAQGVDGNNVVGRYTDADGVTHGFLDQAVAVPEPSGFALLGVTTTIAAICHCLRRRKGFPFLFCGVPTRATRQKTPPGYL